MIADPQPWFFYRDGREADPGGLLGDPAAPHSHTWHLHGQQDSPQGGSLQVRIVGGQFGPLVDSSESIAVPTFMNS